MKDKNIMGELEFKATQEELDAPTFTEWSDERIAKLVREMAVKLRGREVTGWEGCLSMAASMVLIGLCEEANVDEFTQKLGYYNNGENDKKWDWKIIVKKIENKGE